MTFYLELEKNPKLVLQNIKKQQKEVKELIEQGDHDKAADLKKDLAWKKAFDKTEGLKVTNFFVFQFIIT